MWYIFHSCVILQISTWCPQALTMVASLKARKICIMWCLISLKGNSLSLTWSPKGRVGYTAALLLLLKIQCGVEWHLNMALIVNIETWTQGLSAEGQRLCSAWRQQIMFSNKELSLVSVRRAPVWQICWHNNHCLSQSHWRMNQTPSAFSIYYHLLAFKRLTYRWIMKFPNF